MKNGWLIGGVVAALLVPEVALAWWAWNRHEVLPVSKSVFEVIGRPGSGPREYWCGAGDYVYRNMGAPGVQRVYIVEAIGPSVNRPGKKSVKFSLTPPKGVSTSPGYSLSVKAVGDNLSAAAAQQYCYDGGYDERIIPRF
jgi:hypothetical protein